MTWPAVLFWLMFVAGVFSSGPASLYLLYTSIGFGTLQMAPIDANILPQVVASVFLVAKVASRKGNIARLIGSAINIEQAGIFTLFLVYAIISAFALPRLFSGLIEVVPIAGDVSGTELIHPASGNITQLGYLIVSYAVCLSFSILDQRAFYERFLVACLIAGIVLIATGIVDYVSYYGGEGLLSAFRTTSYSLLTDVESVGTKRIVGLQAEASTYGGACVSTAALLLFLRPCFAGLLCRHLVLPTTILLMGLAVMSTSSTAYLGLAASMALYGADLFIAALPILTRTRRRIFWEAFFFVAVAFAVATAIVFIPSLNTTVQQVISTTILDKQTSQSYMQRSMWTRVGWEAFVSSGVAGVGYGSIRTSNWFVSILSSTGLFGGTVMALFLIALLVRKPRSDLVFVHQAVKALRLCLLVTNLMYFFAGTIPDIGVWVASLYGALISLLCVGAERPTPSAEPASPRRQKQAQFV